MSDKKIPRPWVEWDYGDDCLELENGVLLEFEPNDDRTGYGSFVINAVITQEAVRHVFISIADNVAEYIIENPEEFGLTRMTGKRRCNVNRNSNSSVEHIARALMAERAEERERCQIIAEAAIRQRAAAKKIGS